jgi:hypothetical protein
MADKELQVFRRKEFWQDKYFKMLLECLLEDPSSIALVKDLIERYEYIFNEKIKIKSAVKKRKWIISRLSKLLIHRLYGYSYYLEAVEYEYLKDKGLISDLLINCHEGYSIIVLIYIYFFKVYDEKCLPLLNILDILREFAEYKFIDFQLLGRTNVKGFKLYIEGYIKYVQTIYKSAILTHYRHDRLLKNIKEEALTRNRIDQFNVMYDYLCCRIAWVSAVVRISRQRK